MIQNEEDDDWIKNIVGDDGLTAREREEQVYQEVKRLQEAKHEGNDDTMQKRRQ